MNLASFVNPLKARFETPRLRPVELLRIQATVLAQGALGSVKDGVLAFRFMRSVLIEGMLPSK